MKLIQILVQCAHIYNPTFAVFGNVDNNDYFSNFNNWRNAQASKLEKSYFERTGNSNEGINADPCSLVLTDVDTYDNFFDFNNWKHQKHI